MSKYRFVGAHADTLASGQPVGYDDNVSLDAEAQKDPHNRRLIDEHLLLEVPAKTAKSEKDGDR